MSLLSVLVNHAVASLGVDGLVPILEEEAISQLKGLDHETIARKFELPEAEINALAAKTGVDPAVALAKRNAFGEAAADFILSFVPAA